MNLPGKWWRNSMIPRSPWPKILVSVNSDGSSLSVLGFLVPVGRVVLEEGDVRVKAVYKVEFQHVDDVGPDQAPFPYLYRVALVVESNGVDGVDLV
jgi:hypothetical protein